jgi:hypothetical protein
MECHTAWDGSPIAAWRWSAARKRADAQFVSGQRRCKPLGGAFLERGLVDELAMALGKVGGIWRG